MAVLLSKDIDIHVGALGFQSSIYLGQLQSKLQGVNKAFICKQEETFIDILEDDSIQVVVIKDEDLMANTIVVKHNVISGYGQITYGAMAIEEYLVNEHTGDILLYCEEE